AGTPDAGADRRIAQTGHHATVIPQVVDLAVVGEQLADLRVSLLHHPGPFAGGLRRRHVDGRPLPAHDRVVNAHAQTGATAGVDILRDEVAACGGLDAVEVGRGGIPQAKAVVM